MRLRVKKRRGFSKNKNVRLLLWATVEADRLIPLSGTRINIYMNVVLLKTDELIKVVNATKQVLL